MDIGVQSHYFLSAPTGAGYCSFFSHFLRQEGRRVHVLKGGAGCGKSGFLRRLAARGEANGLHTVCFHCAGDPNSLDGVFFPEISAGCLDGTPPHVCDPVSFGATGRWLDLGQFCRTEALDAPRIRELEAARKLFTRRAAAYLSAAAALDPHGIPGLLTPEDRAAAVRRAESTACRELGARPKTPAAGACEYRFLSAVTGEGIVRFGETPAALADRIYLLDNMCGLAEDYLCTIRTQALARGLRLVVCPDPLHPARTEALLIPERRLAFLAVQGTPALPEHPAVRHIRLDAIPDARRLRTLRPKLRADTKLLQQTVTAAVGELHAAALLHEELESLFHSCMDFAALSAFTAQELERAFPNRA